jgi:hypothetical protein
MSEIEDAASEIIGDIATLARQLANTEPYHSASGPDALLAFAAHLDAMLVTPGPSRVVQVAVRRKRPMDDDV